MLQLAIGVLGQRPPNGLWDLGTLYAYSGFVHNPCVGMYTLYTIRRPVYGRIRIPFKRVNPFRTRPFSKQAERLYGRDGNRRDGPSTRRRRERIGALGGGPGVEAGADGRGTVAALLTAVHPSVVRRPVDETPVFTTVRRRDGTLRGPTAQRRDGTVVRPSVRLTVLDGYDDDP
ncbi:hypothetical protein DFH08DRAFT_809267 [Mycena albidolilacea]|uniref:Uncharacterized protein n=1 Tax=Mycena albidolilacea TaxID=1033008 RepID=A0AAD7A1B7_9AGAR|nr:hypothetical protein DFH08DRAFT_809267 [Mycena albidolilacea]